MIFLGGDAFSESGKKKDRSTIMHKTYVVISSFFFQSQVGVNSNETGKKKKKKKKAVISVGASYP